MLSGVIGRHQPAQVDNALVPAIRGGVCGDGPVQFKQEIGAAVHPAE